jgi:hypothetical protein
MNKLKVQLEDLVVDGFSTTPTEKEKGTIVGYSHWTCYNTCAGLPTCAQTCPETCVETCDDFSCVESCGGTCWNPRCQDSNICP